MEKKKLIKVTALVAGVAVLITAIAVPIALTSKKSSGSPSVKTNTNWRRFVSTEQLHTLTEEQAQFRINQARLLWPTWLDVVEPDGTIKPGATIDPISGAITPGSISSITSVTVTEPTTSALIESINVGQDLEYAFTNIVYSPNVATTLPALVQEDLGEGKPTGWKDAAAAKTKMQEILTGVTVEALEDIETTEDLEDYLEDKDLDDDDAEDAYEAELIALVDLPANQVDEVEFYVEKVGTGESATYTLNPIVTLEDDFFASAQPEALTGLKFANDLTQVYEIDWAYGADVEIQKLIDEAPTRLTTAQQIQDHLRTKTTEILGFLEGSTEILDETSPFTLEVEAEDEDDEEEQEFELKLTLNPKTGFELEDDEIDLDELKASQEQAIHWISSTIQSTIKANNSINDLVSLNTWLADAANGDTIKTWFTNPELISTLSVSASGTGPFVLKANIVPTESTVALPSSFSNLKIANSVNWIANAKTIIQNSLVPIASIQDGPSFNAWLSDPVNNETIMGWFTNTQNVKSIQVSATGQDAITLAAEITMNSGFVNRVQIATITGLNDGKHLNNTPIREAYLVYGFINEHVNFAADNVDFEKKLNAALQDPETARELINILITNDTKIYIEGVSATASPGPSYDETRYQTTFFFRAKDGYTLQHNNTSVLEINVSTVPN